MFRSTCPTLGNPGTTPCRSRQPDTSKTGCRFWRLIHSRRQSRTWKARSIPMPLRMSTIAGLKSLWRRSTCRSSFKFTWIYELPWGPGSRSTLAASLGTSSVDGQPPAFTTIDRVMLCRSAPADSEPMRFSTARFARIWLRAFPSFWTATPPFRLSVQAADST